MGGAVDHGVDRGRDRAARHPAGDSVEAEAGVEDDQECQQQRGQVRRQFPARAETHRVPRARLGAGTKP